MNKKYSLRYLFITNIFPHFHSRHHETSSYVTCLIMLLTQYIERDKLETIILKRVSNHYEWLVLEVVELSKNRNNYEQRWISVKHGKGKL